MVDKNSYVQVKNILLIIFILNLTVSLAKIIYGIYTNVSSMTADGFHSFSDSTSNIIGLIAIYISSKPPDTDHPYGHEKFETLATIAISFLLFFISYTIIINSYKRFINPIYPKINIYSFIVIIVTLVINFFVARYESKKGRELKSDILISDSIHTKSDMYVSISVLVSLFSIKIGFIFLDIIISIIIALFIIKAGLEILVCGMKVLCDGAMIDSSKVYEFVINIDEVVFCHKIRSHGKENSIIIDLHIGLDKSLTLEESHSLSHNIQDMIINNFKGVKEVIIHIEPGIKQTHGYKS